MVIMTSIKPVPATPQPVYRRIVQIEMVISGCAEWRNVKMAAVAHDGTLWLGDPSTADPNWHQVPALPPILPHHETLTLRGMP